MLRQIYIVIQTIYLFYIKNFSEYFNFKPMLNYNYILTEK